jgi:hypothetical protein
MKKLLALGAVIAAALFTTPKAEAASGAFLTSLYVTNTFSATTLFGYPTNGTGVGPTNGFYIGTGQAAYIGTEDTYGILFQGYLVTTNTNSTSFGLTFVSAMSQSTPISSLYTSNSWNTNYPWTTNTAAFSQNDFEFDRTNGNLVFVFTTPTNATASVATNWFNFQTNITSTVIPDASWLGLFVETNNMSSGSFATNIYIGINQKWKISPFAQ